MTGPAAARVPLRVLLPMLCSADLTRDLDPAGWAWEVRWDGWRCQHHSTSPTLWSRQGRSLRSAFPDVLHAAATALGGRDVVLDGELVVLDAGGRPDCTALSARAGCQSRAAVSRAAAAAPATLIVFDVLHLNGRTCAPTHGRPAGPASSSSGSTSTSSRVCRPGGEPGQLRRRRGADPGHARAGA